MIWIGQESVQMQVPTTNTLFQDVLGKLYLDDGLDEVDVQIIKSSHNKSYLNGTR